jgi:hypothetical protein
MASNDLDTSRTILPSLLWPMASGSVFLATVLLSIVANQQAVVIIFSIGMLLGIMTLITTSIYLYHRVVQSAISRATFWISHIVILFLGQVSANLLFEHTIGLPMSDFPFAASVAYILGIILMYIALAVIALILACIGLNLASAPFFPWAKKTRTMLILLGYLFAAFCGITVLGVLALVLVEGSHQTLLASAYWGDCSSLSSYPGVTHEGRSRLHENGIITTIHAHEGTFRLVVGRFIETPALAPVH